MTTEPLVEKNNEDDNTSTVLDSEFVPNILVYKDDQQFGLHSVEQIQTLLQEGVFVTGDLVWVGGWESYMPIENVSDLIEGLGERCRRVASHEN